MNQSLTVGDELVLEVEGRQQPWVVVGIAQVLSGPPNVIPAYVNYPYFAEFTRTVGRGDSAQILLNDGSPENINAMVDVIQAALDEQGMNVASIFTIERLRRITGGFFDVIVYLLLAMGVLIASVGALGLMGTMSTNVLERTREIGVMRAIGASDGAVLRIVIVEGILIGLISWAIGGALAFPVGAALSNAVGLVLFQTQLPYTFAASGVITWLGVVTYWPVSPASCRARRFKVDGARSAGLRVGERMLGRMQVIYFLPLLLLLLSACSAADMPMLDSDPGSESVSESMPTTVIAPVSNAVEAMPTMDLQTLFRFDSAENAGRWGIVNDSVMGGISESGLALLEEDALLFTGNVSLENNGGFASMRSAPTNFGISNKEGIRLIVRGDGNTYRLRLYASSQSGVAYEAPFATISDEWQTVLLPFTDFTPTIRGRVLADYPA